MNKLPTDPQDPVETEELPVMKSTIKSYKYLAERAKRSNTPADMSNTDEGLVATIDLGRYR